MPMGRNFPDQKKAMSDLKSCATKTYLHTKLFRIVSAFISVPESTLSKGVTNQTECSFSPLIEYPKNWYSRPARRKPCTRGVLNRSFNMSATLMVESFLSLDRCSSCIETRRKHS